MTRQAAALIAAACLAGCSQIQYAGTQYVFAADDAAAVGYIELGCMYRTADASGCAGAVKLAGNPYDAISDPVINRGTWWLEPSDGGDAIKIRWNSGEVAYIPAERFDRQPPAALLCSLSIGC